MLNICVAKGDYFKSFSKKIPQFSIQHYSVINLGTWDGALSCIIGEIMNELIKNLANLVKVKTIVTLIVTGVFAVLSLKGVISADNVMIIISMVVSFYFGTQHEKAS